MMVRNYIEKTEKRLTVYGPPETKKRLQRIWDSKHFEGHFEKGLPGFVKLTVVEYEDRKPIEHNRMKITPFFLSHGNMPATALRFEAADKVFVYSGDTGMNEEIKEAAKDSDLFLCECNQRPETENAGHLNPSQVGKIANESNVKRVVLTHMPNVDQDSTLIQDVEKGGFKGNVEVGHDFDVLQL
jgi:ribonuclease BN (tRNA processing enzyme)